MSYFDLKQKRDSLWLELDALARQEPLRLEVIQNKLNELAFVDRFWTYPGRAVQLRLAYYLAEGLYSLFAQLLNNCTNALKNGRYRQQSFSPFQTNLDQLDRPAQHDAGQLKAQAVQAFKAYFEVLIIHPYPADYEMLYRQHLATLRSAQDEFLYDIVFVDCAEDAITAALANSDIQCCVYLGHLPAQSAASAMTLDAHGRALVANTPPLHLYDSVEVNLCRTLKCLRPELEHYLISELAPIELPLEIRAHFDRLLFHINPFLDLHAVILNGVRNRFSTPFFDALQTYSKQPKGVFHALPLSRGASVKGSPWIHDMLDFYGDNIFLAETSATQGGLDSLLEPTGAIKQSHHKAAQTFGADYSYFVTNGTSTSNKIVMQANLRPGDIVLISADCHKSIPYAVMLAGAYPIFLETYPLPEYDLYGGIDLAQIKAVMLDLKKQGRLHRLKQITLTNSTFDGLIYHCERFMAEILAIKPDVVIHWDEAWFAFAHFHPLYFSRTAMSAVHKIRQRMQSSEYQQFYAQWAMDFEARTDEAKWQEVLYPDPRLVQLRVYVTQSTHKTLTSFRQGSMIHVADVQFSQQRFLDAFRIHTSTSPNYQIIASLDIARRQAALEGFHKVRESILLAMQLRERIAQSARLAPYFTVLGDEELIPQDYRQTVASASHSDLIADDLSRLSHAWGVSDFVIDPTRITIDVRGAGIDGSSFRQLLMTRYDIQVNKTSRHTVLFLINIGATQETIDYLLQVLEDIAARLSSEQRQRRQPEHSGALIAMPKTRIFHPLFVPYQGGQYAACDLRHAYIEGGDDANIDYVPLSSETLDAIAQGQQWVSAAFVTPYPPGFPVIVPGQVLTIELLQFFQHIKVKEIHGFSFELGFKVFRSEYLSQQPVQ